MPSRPILLLICLALSACGPEGRQVTLDDTSRLLPDDGSENHYFGIAVALSDDRAVIAATGTSDQGLRSGSVTVYRKRNAAWMLDEKLMPARGVTDNRFGSALALENDVLAVAARGPTTEGRHSGSVHLFEERDGVFVEIRSFTSELRNDRFGTSVDLTDTRLAVGAPGDARYGIDAGAVYVYRKMPEGWLLEQRIHALQPTPRVRFGAAVSLEGTRLAVGAPGDDRKGTGSGAVHLFRLADGRAVGGTVLRSPNSSADGGFGTRLDQEGERLFVGAPMEDGWLRDIGVVHIFRRQGENWVQEEELTTGIMQGGVFFGNALDADGDRLLVGARGHDVVEWESGSAHLFRRTSSGWKAEAYLAPKRGIRNGYFGHSVGLAGRQGIVGSYGSRARGPWSGAVYLF